MLGDEDLVFTIEELRSPLVQLSKHMKQRITTLKKLHKKIDEEFLEKRIEHRFVVIVADGLNMETFDKKPK